MVMGMLKIQSLKKLAKGCFTNLKDLLFTLRPMKQVALKLLHPKAEAILCPVKNLYNVSFPITKHKKTLRKRSGSNCTSTNNDKPFIDFRISVAPSARYTR